MKTIRQIASQIANLEGKKSQARIGDIREILSILSDIIYQSATPLKIPSSSVCIALYLNGEKRAKKQSKSCKIKK